MPQQWRYTLIMVPHKKKDRTECGNCRSISLVAHAGKVLLKELAQKKYIPLYVYFIDLTKSFDYVDRTLLWTVLARFAVPQNMISVICQFHDGMRACMRLDDRVCSG